MKKEIDLRGLTCPEPVLKTKALLDDQNVTEVVALVDGEVNVNNLSRLARSLKLQFGSEKLADHYSVSLVRKAKEGSESSGAKAGGKEATADPPAVLSASATAALAASAASAAPSSAHAHFTLGAAAAKAAAAADTDRKEEVGTVIFLGKDKFGEGDPEFSNTLISLFLQTTLASGHQPRAIVMANSGVKLMSKNSSSLKVLNDFKNTGVEVLACGLCVEFYKLKGEIPAEQITNMFAICEYMFAADKVITL